MKGAVPLAADAQLAGVRQSGNANQPDRATAPYKAELIPPYPDHASLMGAQDRAGCCGTMQLVEYARDQKKLDADLERLSEEGAMIPEVELLAEEVVDLKQAFK